MKHINALPKTLLILFFITAVLVHVVGLAKPFSDETPLSHIVHVVSYGLCLFAVLRQINFGVLLYFFGSLYPYFIHARCSYVQYMELNKLNAICIYTVVMLTAGFAFVVFAQRKSNS